jgi:hypothetical protein
MNWTREDFEKDRLRYETALAALLESGLSEEHALVRRQRRRIAVVDRVLTDPAFGMVQPETEEQP